MPPRHHRLDRTLREPQWVMRAITVLILLAGAGVVVYAFTRSEARRERAVGDLEVGDTVTRVTERLGAPPAVCATGSLEHLQGQFPAGWPAAAQQVAIEQLREQTTQRWLYPLDEQEVLSCSAVERGTEIGVGPDGRILWYVPLSGRQPLQLPDTLAPGRLLDNDTIPDDA